MKARIIFPAVFALALSGCAFVNISLYPKDGPLREQVISGAGRDKVVLVDISGMISSSQRKEGIAGQRPSIVSEIKESLTKAESDRHVKGLILRVDSPGGTVTASDIIYHEIMGFKKRTGLPVYSIIMNAGTSGAYYVSCAADKIYSHPTSITGSIGVLALKLNMEGMFQKIGIMDKTVKSGELKDMYSPFRPETDMERDVLQGMINQLYERFISVVHEGRGGRLRESSVEEFKDGRPYTAGQALGLGLIDKIAYMDDAVSDLIVQAGLKEARLVAYKRAGGHAASPYSMNPSGTQINLININAGGIDAMSGVQFMYLWGF